MLQLLKLVLCYLKNCLAMFEKMFKNVTSTTLPKSYFLVCFRFIKYESREYTSKVFIKRKWYGLWKEMVILSIQTESLLTIKLMSNISALLNFLHFNLPWVPIQLFIILLEESPLFHGLVELPYVYLPSKRAMVHQLQEGSKIHKEACSQFGRRAMSCLPISMQK